MSECVSECVLVVSEYGVREIKRQKVAVYNVTVCVHE